MIPSNLIFLNLLIEVLHLIITFLGLDRVVSLSINDVISITIETLFAHILIRCVYKRGHVLMTHGTREVSNGKISLCLEVAGMSPHVLILRLYCIDFILIRSIIFPVILLLVS